MYLRVNLKVGFVFVFLASNRAMQRLYSKKPHYEYFS